MNRAERALRFLAEAKGPVSHSALERAISLSPGGPMRSARTAVSELRQMGIRIPPAEIREGEGWYELQDPEAWAKFRVSKGNGGPGGGKSSPDAPLRSLCAENPKSEPSGVSPGSALAAKRWEGHTPRRFKIAGREVTMKEYKAILAEKKQGSLL